MKKRGAQPQNNNAFKHGFYSSEFKQKERRALSKMSTSELAAEIELLRVANLRFLQALNSAPEPLDLETQLSALRAISLSAHSINSMIRTHLILAPGDREADETINHLMSFANEDDKLLSETNEEIGLLPSPETK